MVIYQQAIFWGFIFQGGGIIPGVILWGRNHQGDNLLGDNLVEGNFSRGNSLGGSLQEIVGGQFSAEKLTQGAVY